MATMMITGGNTGVANCSQSLSNTFSFGGFSGYPSSQGKVLEACAEVQVLEADYQWEECAVSSRVRFLPWVFQKMGNLNKKKETFKTTVVCPELFPDLPLSPDLQAPAHGRISLRKHPVSLGQEAYQGDT